jgi:SM-20-related protein
VACAIPAETIARSLAECGWWSGDGIVDAPLLDRLRSSLTSHVAAGRLAPAAVGRGALRRIDASVRGDSTRWLDGAEAPERELFEALARLRLGLNHALYLGLVHVEAHYALYAPGTGYVRHMDTFVDSPERTISFVLFLNEGWSDVDGGELVLYRKDSSDELARVVPTCGRLVMFVSGEIPHAVRPGARPRMSIAGWFRRRS